MRPRRRAERGHFAPAVPARGQVRRTDERRQQRLLYGVAIALGIFVVALLAWGFYTSTVRPPRKVVAQVGEAKVQLEQVATYNRLMRGVGRPISPTGVVNILIRNEILRQEGETQYPVVVTPEDIDQRLADEFETLLGENGDPSTSLTPEGRQLYEEFLSSVRVSNKDYLAYIESEIMVEKLRAHFALLVPEAEEQVYLQFIVVDTPERSEEVLQRLEEGEEFGALAQEINEGPYADYANGEVGWVPRELFPDLAEAIFAAQIGEPIGPLTSSLGSVVAQITQGPELQPVSEDVRQALGDSRITLWLQAQLVELLVDYTFDDDDRSWVIQRSS